MTPKLRPADTVDITVLVDNYTDLLLTEHTDDIIRPSLPDGQTLRAEHGLSFFIRVTSGPQVHHILMDAGASENTLPHNASLLNINMQEIDEIVLSHGHYDHFGSLIPILRSSGSRIPVHMHPAAFHRRREKCADGTYTEFPALHKDAIMHAGGILNLSHDPSLIADGLILLTGEIERTTAFEQGAPNLEAIEDGAWMKDSFPDDQSLIIHLAGKGLIIISGCAHAGIINSVRYARKITGIETILTIIGGFHLSGPHFGQIIPKTITAMQEINPSSLIPLHCTGMQAIHQFMQEMPDRITINTVGTTYRL